MNLDEKIIKLRDEGYPIGQYPGFQDLYKIFSWKAGYPVYVAGAPHHGKTQFVIEQLVYKSEFHGEKHACYLGETGEVEEIYAEIIYSYKKKPFFKHKAKGEVNKYAMSDEEFFDALQWSKHHFVVVEDFNPFTMWGFYKKIDELEKQLDIKFNTTLVDPFMHLDMPDEYGGKEHLHLKSALKHCNDNGKEHKRTNILINHIADLPYQTDENGNRFYPMAMPNEWAGGRMWHRFAYTMLLVYRCPQGVMGKDGQPYLENQTFIQNQKAKPKGSGKLGDSTLFWDWKKNRYYEDAITAKLYAHDKPI